MSSIFDSLMVATQLQKANQTFVLLDDALAESAQSRLYVDLQQVLLCAEKTQWPTLIEGLEQALHQGYYAVSLLSYETGAQLLNIQERETPAISKILLFKTCYQLNQNEVVAFLAHMTAGDQDQHQVAAGIAHIRANVNEQQFDAAIAKVQSYIAAGDTYQVNYTYRLHFDAYGSPLHLYRRLRERQPVPYGALIVLPEGEAVVSMSPELFVRHSKGQLQARPMKGTAAATGDAVQDQKIAAELAADMKNRAENLMIVDLLRNDLGRIAETGTVSVPKLFEVTRFSSVLQMTSTVNAQLRKDLTLVDILTALFPCGSITGAPKHRTMEIIREIESAPRDLYTGAIGWFDPPAKELRIQQIPGDFCLSVPIRTLQLQAPDTAHSLQVRRGVMGVGAGIVYDSVASDEFAECQLKARFLTGLQAPFELFETMYATYEDGCRRRYQHLQRLRHSAEYFGFKWDETEITHRLQQACDKFLPQTPYRLRLSINPNGQVSVNTGVLTPFDSRPQVLLAETMTHSRNLFLQHKTSLRQQYDAAWKTAEQRGAFDMLFFNEHGYLTEGGRSNVLLQIDGRWYTPPLSDGVLPGIMRGELLNDPRYRLSEKSLTRDDLQHAQQIMLCNSLRGVFSVDLVSD
ncbi:aminodeoxychorismate synthase component I [Undibacterium sp. Dicai25W]|uniref:aminodeoxychorismate synthase component I n=1 Tax=Undibacterium sp. Dicai25W TaxID=3413034 RepID=UPI003BEFBA11